jgi:hypothetical protein
MCLKICKELYNSSVTEVHIITLVIKMCSTEPVVKSLYAIQDGLKQGDALWPLLLSPALENAIRKVQVNQEGLKLNATHELLDY